VLSTLQNIQVPHPFLSVPSSEYHILIILIAKHILGILLVSSSLPLIPTLIFSIARRIRRFGIPLFSALDFLQSVEFFAVEFVEFGVDVFDCVFCARNDDVLALFPMLVFIEGK
jgi:hypothetical protein